MSLTPALPRLNLLASPKTHKLQAFLDVYRHICTFDIIWDTNLIAIPDASPAQIQDLTQRKSDYPKVQTTLRSMELGSDPYLEVTIENNHSDKYAHVILAHGRTNDGTRRIGICEFRQCRSLSAGGLVGPLIACGVVGYFSPAAGIIGFITKVAADYALSKQDVSAVVTIKELVRAGFLRLNETNMQLSLP
ncbi:unnamed protein product [Adineta ricciae]|uniref:Uncharacterized protein n=1 Tax=Adineta ricciae TaxID=249248 RepID=A0A814YC06_ADIRI|nr:unnamed protein product [Adineta ricciae]CAF1324400.1 unnamed protein product [Adineta ricciae]